MKLILLVVFGVGVAACTAPSGQSNHLNLNVKECRALAEETFRSGKLNFNLCPGYTPDGQDIELT